MSTGEITGLIRSRYGPVLVLVDGAEWHKLPRAVVRALGFVEGKTYDLDRLLAEAEDLAGSCALERGLYLTSSRERSRLEVLRALQRDGYTEQTAQSVVERLVELGAVDDARFAGALARSAAGGRGFGRRRVARLLREAGIAEGLADEALESAVPIEAESGRALQHAKRMARSSGDSVPRLAARLVRRGFDSGVAWNAARVALGDEAEGADQAPPDETLSP